MEWKGDEFVDSGDGPVSGRSRDALLAAVVRRGQRLALRRRLGLTALAIMAALSLVPAGVLAVRDDGGQPEQVSASAGTSVTGSPTTTMSPTGTTLVGGAVEPIADPLPLPATAPPTTSRPSRPPTNRPAPRVTAAPVTSSPRPLRADCGSPLLDITGYTAKPSYLPGDPVTANTSVTNTTQSPCVYSSYAVSMRILDPTGREVEARSINSEPRGEVTLNPREVLTAQFSAWNQNSCDGGQPCSPGPYIAVFTWRFSGSAPVVETSAPFKLAPRPTTTTAPA